MTQVTVNSRAFSGALKAAQSALATGKEPTNLHAVQLRHTNAALLVVGCDGARLHLASLNAKGTAKRGGQVLLPGRELSKVQAALASKTGAVAVAFGPDFLTIDGARVASIDHEAPYVDWEPRFESAQSAARGLAFEVVRAPFLSLVEKVLPLASDEPENAVYVVPNAGALYLGVNTTGGPLFLPCGTATGNEFSFAMNARFLRDALASATGDSFSGRLESPTKPLVFKAGDFSGLIMPCDRKAPAFPAQSGPKTMASAARVGVPETSPPGTPKMAPRVSIDAVSPCEVTSGPQVETPVQSAPKPLLGRAELSAWALDYVATLVNENPRAAARLQKSLDFQLSQLGTVSPAQWKENAQAAFEAKVAKGAKAEKVTV